MFFPPKGITQQLCYMGVYDSIQINDISSDVAGVDYLNYLISALPLKILTGIG